MTAAVARSRAALPTAFVALVAAVVLAGLTAGPTGAAGSPTRSCGALRTKAKGFRQAYKATAIRAHLTTCKHAKQIIRKWIRKGFPAGRVMGPWTCAYAPGAKNPDCVAGKNGFIHFKLKPRASYYAPGTVRGG